MHTRNNFVVQGSILAIAGIIVRLIGMLYRIPLIEIIGTEGNGYYTSAFSVYSILLIVSSYSLPTAVSKMVAGRIAVGQYKNSQKILKAALIYATVVGALAGAVLWFGADLFAQLLGMPFCRYALKTLAPTVWIMAYLGVLRGYFQGHGTMVPTAVSQLFEQIVNAVVSIGAASWLVKKGLEADLVYGETEYASSFGAAGGTLGTGAGAAIALAFFLLLLFLYRPVMRRQLKKDKTGREDSFGKIAAVLTITILPIVLSSTVYNISSVLDNYLFASGLRALGEEDQMAALWGVFGEYHLLFNIPVALANALSSSLIPALANAVAMRDRKAAVQRTRTAIRFSMIIAIPAAVGLSVLAEPICNLLFASHDNELLIKLMVAGSAAVVFFSLSTMTNAILQGTNHMSAPLIHSAIALIPHVLFLVIFQRVMGLGIYSVVYSNVLFALVVCILNQLAIRKYLRYRQEYKKTFLVPIACSAIMGFAAFGAYTAIYSLLPEGMASGRLGIILALCPAILAAVLIYGVLLLRFGGFSDKELKEMPMGTRLLGAARKLHLR
ncbi:MAG: polysaccharide biosynthesis C-terminal domain-containing protein [Lachnospirales bacterium]